MPIYTTPPLSAVDFSLTIYTQPSTVYPASVLSLYTVPPLSGTDFSLISYTPTLFAGINFELGETTVVIYNRVLMIICNC